jgi:uncharacterized protein YjiS (DUF1127 family)
MHLVMAESLVQDRATSSRSPARLGALLRLPVLWFVRASRRKELRSLEAEQVEDCGLDPIAIRREAAKPFWRE